MVDPTIIAGGFEILKLITQAMIAAQRQAGLSDEEMDKFIFDQREEFKKRPASALPDV